MVIGTAPKRPHYEVHEANPKNYGWHLEGINKESRVEFWRRFKIFKMDYYYTTGTVKTCMDHPRLGKTQLFRRNLTEEEFVSVLKEPRTHTNKGYHKKDDTKRRRRKGYPIIQIKKSPPDRDIPEWGKPDKDVDYDRFMVVWIMDHNDAPYPVVAALSDEWDCFFINQKLCKELNLHSLDDGDTEVRTKIGSCPRTRVFTAETIVDLEVPLVLGKKFFKFNRLKLEGPVAFCRRFPSINFRPVDEILFTWTRPEEWGEAQLTFDPLLYVED